MKSATALLLVSALAVPAWPAAKDDARGAAADGRLYVDISAADYVEVIDLAKRKVVGKIVVGMHPHGLAIVRRTVAGRTREFLYVTVEDTGELVVVDAESNQVVSRVRVGAEPNQLTLSRDARYAYVPLRGEAKVAVVDLGAGAPAGRSAANGLTGSEPQPRVIKQVAIGEWPHNSYTGQTTGRIYITSFRGRKIHVFDPQRHEPLFEIEFPGEVRPVALSRDETRAYVALSDFHGFVVADIGERKVIQRVELPPLPPGTPEPYLKTYVHGLALSPDERELWVTSCAGNALYVYSLPELKLRGKVPTGKFPHWLAWQPSAASTERTKASDWLLWVSQMDSNQVSAVDPQKRAVVATIPTGPAPRRIVIAQ